MAEEEEGAVAEQDLEAVGVGLVVLEGAVGAAAQDRRSLGGRRRRGASRRGGGAGPMSLKASASVGTSTRGASWILRARAFLSQGS